MRENKAKTKLRQGEAILGVCILAAAALLRGRAPR